MATTQTLCASGAWGYEGKQYIARITGRAAKVTFCREFVGTKDGKRSQYTEYTTDEPGLYERQSVSKKGKDRHYVALLEHGAHLRSCSLTLTQAMSIAKRLAKENLEDIVRVEEVEGETNDDGLPVVKFVIGSSKKSPKQSALERCQRALSSLMAHERAWVLAELGK